MIPTARTAAAAAAKQEQGVGQVDAGLAEGAPGAGRGVDADHRDALAGQPPVEGGG